jgi:hypothetical protein
MFKKLAALKKEVGAISKEETNPYFKSKYFDINGLINHLQPLLDKNGLVLLQPIINGIVTSEIHDVESGQIIKSELVLPTFDDPQKLGSCITYYRRYTLQSLLGLQAEDDDANKASENRTSVSFSAKKDDPTDWLNLFDKKGTETAKFHEIQMALASGKEFTLTDIRKKYKVSKQTQDELKQHFNIV